MNPSLIDPLNHVPAASPADGWEDAKACAPDAVNRVVSLPSRSVIPEPSQPEPALTDAGGMMGIEVNSEPRMKLSKTSPTRLEVQEIETSVVRLRKTLPSPQKVVARETKPFQPMVHESRRPEEGQKWGHETRNEGRWILKSGIAVAILLILGIGLLPIINQPNAARERPDDHSLHAVEEEAVEGIDDLNRLVSKQAEAEQIFRAYTRATTVADVLSLLRERNSVEPLVRQSWQPLENPSQQEPTEMAWNVLDGRPFKVGVLSGRLPDHSNFQAYLVEEENRLTLDWKATSGFGTASFEDLGKGSGDAAEIRGTISPADFYTATWPEADYQSYQFVSPKGDQLIWCYAKRDNEVGALIANEFYQSEIVAEASGPKQMTVRLARGPSDAAPNQWLIAELLYTDWTKPVSK